MMVIVDSKIVGSEMDSVEVKNMVGCNVSLTGSGVVGVVGSRVVGVVGSGVVGNVGSGVVGVVGSGVVGVVDSGVVGVVGGSVVGFRVLEEVMESIVIGIVVNFLTGGKEDT